MKIRGNQYFRWLLRELNIDDDFEYVELCYILHNISYQWDIKMDENRNGDALALRYDYETDKNKECPIAGSHATFLEFLIALAKRITHATSYIHDDLYWFMYLLDQMGLLICTDSWFEDSSDPYGYITNATEIVMHGYYDPDGSNGGLFYVEHPDKDLRNAEIWHQLQQWVIENYMPED